jgi:hypothetical protein
MLCGRTVMDILCRIKAQAVEVKFLDPVTI